MSPRIHPLSALPALIGVVLLLLTGWGLDGDMTGRSPVTAHHAEHSEPTIPHDTSTDAACALMCLAQRSVFGGPEGYRKLARVADSPSTTACLLLSGCAPAPPQQPPKFV